MLNVHLRINDAAAGTPTPVRLRVTGPDGTAYPPLGRYDVFPCGTAEDVGGHVRAGKENFAYIDGACEIPLPAGVPLRIQAFKGPAYAPLDRVLTLGAGQLAVRLEMARLPDAGDWLSADSRAHFLSPHAALLEAAAEDLDIVNLLAVVRPGLAADGNTYPAAANLTAFSGTAAAVQCGGRTVVVNTLNTHAVLGRVALLNAHRPVFPLAAGGADGPDDVGVCDWCDQGRRKGGLAVWADAFANDSVPGGEALVAAVLGKFDAFELDARPRPHSLLPWYYRLLNAGVNLPLVGGSGKDSNRVPLGGMRTLSPRPAGTATYADWVAAVRAGRTTITNGPLLAFAADRRGPGETLAVAGPGSPVAVTASVAGYAGVETIEIIADGVVVASSTGRTLNFEYTPAESGWLAARCVGGPAPLDPTRPAFAHASPVFISVPGKPYSRRRAALPLVRQCVERTREWGVEYGNFTAEKYRAGFLARCDGALVLLAGE